MLRTPNKQNQPAFGQGGFAMLFVIFLLMAVSGVAYWMYAPAAHKASIDLKIKQQTWANDVSAQLNAWYARNLAAIDSNLYAFSTTDILYGNSGMGLGGSGISLQYSAVVLSSVRLSGANGVGFHTFSVYIPVSAAPGAAGTLDTSTGKFVDGVLPGGAPANLIHAYVSGESLELTALTETTNRMRHAATKLEQFFAIKLNADPNHNASINYFRAINCASPAADEIPCYGVSSAVDTDVGVTPIPMLVGIGTNYYQNAWGQNITVENYTGSDANVARTPSGPPFTINMKTISPWGTVYPITGVSQ